jgi:hypothetical protein
MTYNFFYGYALGCMVVQWINVKAIGLIPSLFFTMFTLLLTLTMLYFDMIKLGEKE